MNTMIYQELIDLSSNGFIDGSKDICVYPPHFNVYTSVDILMSGLYVYKNYYIRLINLYMYYY